MAIAIVIAFLALNYRAYTGFFQDDELDTLSWAATVPARQFVVDLIKPTFDVANFRPPGHLYFTLMAIASGENFPPFITPIFALHLLNALLLFLLARRMNIGFWQSLAGTAFFTLSAGALDAYWKPMYVYDLFCASFTLASILFYSHRRWILSFIAFWCAYKSKELAVMLPVVLLAWEHWFGDRRYLRLIPFFLVSLSFGIQGLILNPNKDNEYTFRFTWNALTVTAPFYANRFLLFPASGVLLAALLLIRDRRIWLGLIGTAAFLFVLLFLPGRTYEAYVYLPLACATLAMAAAFSHVKPVWAWIALALWMPLNIRSLHRQQRAILAADNEVRNFVSAINDFAAKNPQIRTLVYENVPNGFHHWGTEAAWVIAHHGASVPAYYFSDPRAKEALTHETVAYGLWDKGALTINRHEP